MALIFLPNATSVTQSMNQGATRSLKDNYYVKVIRKYITAIDSNKEWQNITILDAMIMLKQSWSTLPDPTIITIQSQVSLTRNTDDPFARLTEVFDELRALDPNLAPNDFTAETLIATDKDVATFIQSLQSNEKLLRNLIILLKRFLVNPTLLTEYFYLWNYFISPLGV